MHIVCPHVLYYPLITISILSGLPKEVRKIERGRNMAAHELACHARLHGDFFCLASVPPSFDHIICMDNLRPE